MPHFIIECSQSVIQNVSPDKIVQEVYDAANASGLFAKEGPNGIKVRLKAYEHYTTVNSQDDFVHVFGNIMEGRTEEQKKNLTNAIVEKLVSLLPNSPIVSMNVFDFHKASYCNRSMMD